MFGLAVAESSQAGQSHKQAKVTKKCLSKNKANRPIQSLGDLVSFVVSSFFAAC